MNRGNKVSTVNDTVFVEGQELTDKKQIPEAFNNHFVNIGDKFAGTIEQTDTCPIDNIDETNKRFSFKYIQSTQVFRVLSKLKNGKAVGTHNIPKKSLKLSKDIISNSLADIFNASIINNLFPVDFKLGRVTPLFKGDSREDLNNYRPITVLPTTARIFERLIYNQLYTYFTENNLIGSQQWGFRSLHSTVLALNKTTDSWLLNIDKGRLNSVIFLDIKKAFDTVSHEILLKKLNRYGVCEKELEFFMSYPSDRVHCCSTDGNMSSFQNIKCGVPQGSILGPLLFIIYMDDLAMAVENSKISMYADDTFVSNETRSLISERSFIQTLSKYVSGLKQINLV